MKKRKLIQSMERSIWTPGGTVRNNNWPLCHTCQKDVDGVRIVNEGVGSNGLRYVEVGAEHHGMEEVIRIDFLSKHPTDSDFAAALRACSFFHVEHEDTGFSAGGIG